MKKVFTLLLSLIVFACETTQAQTTVTAGNYTPLVGTTFSTGLTYITFAVRNTNFFPITITNMTCLQANLYENNVYSLYYTGSSLGGAPTVAAPTWTLLSTSIAPITTSTITQVVPFNCIGLTIPPNTTYRFALQGSKGTACRGGAISPNIFTNGGVDVLVGDNILPGQSARVGYFGWQNIGNSGTAYFFDGTITFAPANAFNDIQVLNITKPNAVCASTNSTLTAQVCNKSPHTINFGTNNTTVNFNVTGPGAPQTPSVLLNSGTMAPCGCVNAVVSGIDFSTSGNYNISATATISGVSDINLANNTAVDSLKNYKPVVVPALDSICQFTSPSLFSGFTSSGCQSISKTFVVNTLVNTPVSPDGTSDATASLFATGVLPGLPQGSVITGGSLTIDNLNGVPTGTYGDEARFNIFGPAPNGPATPFLPGVAGSPLNFSVYNFDYTTPVSATILNNMYSALGAGGNFYIGYWETFDDLVGGSDIALNSQTLTTTAKLTINYIINPSPKWFTTPSGGSSLSGSSTFNPFVVLGSGLTNTNTTGNYTFYAACSADSNCRVPVTVQIKPSPIVNQDSLYECELISSTGNAVFDLNSVSSNVANGNGSATVNYYYDAGLSSLIGTPGSFNTGSAVVFSKVTIAGGCSSSDSVVLFVNPKPDFDASLYSAFACAPASIDVASLINPFSTVPIGTDTLYFADAACTVPHPNPHSISTVDTVYMVFVSNTIPACTDTSEADINVIPMTNYIASQDIQFNYSTPGSVGCNTFILTDGSSDTLRTSTDCKRVASITDIADGTSLGSISICQEIDASTQFHNGQPYVNRHYQITPTNNDSALVCLYFLDDDFQQFNASASPIWPALPTALSPGNAVNLAITKVDNGDIFTPGHTAEAIPNSLISSSYDPSTTVWTVCFPVSSFSYFYAHSQNPNNFPLPVHLLSFNARKVEQTSVLEWVTSSEQNNSHFVVERSRDGKAFQPVSSGIPSQGKDGNSTTPLNYQFTDLIPNNGHNYYRLQQFDLDGHLSHSQIADVYFGNESIVTLYPNPAQHELHVDIETPQSTLARLKVMDATGRIVRTVDMQLQAGQNQSSISLEGLADGMYLIKVSNDKGLNYSQTIWKK
ncbi:MAG: T9SS type A sorting domain-containing protein [Chitinophagaceae bacterium]|nr:T9SS type A sorting domain-containing protein [Chitinophagaceae bacterium]